MQNIVNVTIIKRYIRSYYIVHTENIAYIKNSYVAFEIHDVMNITMVKFKMAGQPWI